MLTQEYIRKRFLYIPETGDLFWKEAEENDFTQGNFRTPEQIKNNWNSKNVLKPALNCISINGYREGTFQGKLVKSHRIIWFYMTGKWPYEVDHINGIKTDNNG